MARLAVFLIRVYQFAISPFVPPSCRFYPSCSHYAVQAYRAHGAAWGSWLTLVRLLKCQPWHGGGYDPVPAQGPPPLRRAPRRSPFPTR